MWQAWRDFIAVANDLFTTLVMGIGGVVVVIAHARDMVHEVGIIAHSCGVPEPRRLRRHHCRIVPPDGRSVPLDERYPDPRVDRSAPGEATGG